VTYLVRFLRRNITGRMIVGGAGLGQYAHPNMLSFLFDLEFNGDSTMPHNRTGRPEAIPR